MDAFYPALLEDSRISLGVVVTTDLCREAQSAHALGAIEATALGRLMTAAAMVGSIHGGQEMSLQIVCEGALGQLFADITVDGDLRGYVRPRDKTALAVNDDRLVLSRFMGRGELSVIRLGSTQQFSHSTTRLIAGEIDRDVEYFLETSVQIPSIVVCSVLLDDDMRVSGAGGLILQAMPDSDREAFGKLKRRLIETDLSEQLRQAITDPEGGLKAFGTVRVSDALPLRWRCRCSYERVLSALRMFDPKELAEMVDTGDGASVHCDFCGKDYIVPANELEDVFTRAIIHRGETQA